MAASSRARSERIMLEPHPERSLQAAHVVGRDGQTELRTGDDGVPRGVVDVVDGVCRVNTRVEIELVAQAKRTSHGGVKTELVGSDDGVAACASPRSRRRRGVSPFVEEVSCAAAVERGTGTIGTDGAGDAGRGNGFEIDR